MFYFIPGVTMKVLLPLFSLIHLGQVTLNMQLYLVQCENVFCLYSYQIIKKIDCELLCKCLNTKEQLFKIVAIYQGGNIL